MLEHLAIANYLQKLEVGTETPGRRHKKEKFLSALESVVVQLNEEGDDELQKEELMKQELKMRVQKQIC